MKAKIIELEKANLNLTIKVQERENKYIQFEKLVEYYKEEKEKMHLEAREKLKQMKNFYEGEI